MPTLDTRNSPIILNGDGTRPRPHPRQQNRGVEARQEVAVLVSQSWLIFCLVCFNSPKLAALATIHRSYLRFLDLIGDIFRLCTEYLPRHRKSAATGSRGRNTLYISTIHRPDPNRVLTRNPQRLIFSTPLANHDGSLGHATHARPAASHCLLRSFSRIFS